MPNDTHHSCENPEVNDVRMCLRQAIRQKDGETNRAESFERIHEENGVSPFLSNCTQHVGRPNVSASECADIDSCDSSGKISGRKRSEQITYEADNKREEQHGILGSLLARNLGHHRLASFIQM